MIEFLDAPIGLVCKLALMAAFVDFATGVWRAYQDGIFALDAMGAFIRKHLGGRVLPLSVIAFLGWASGDLTLQAGAAAGLVVYYGETIGSVWSALKVPGSARIPID